MVRVRRTQVFPLDDARGQDDHPGDDEILRAWLGGDRDAGQRFFQRLHEAVRSFISRRTREDVDDLVQQTFLACMTTGENYRGHGSARSFLLGIARNQLSSMWRQRARTARDTIDCFPAPSADDADHANECDEARTAALERALPSLPHDLLEAVRLIYWDGLTRDVAAQRISVAPGTIASRVRLAKLRLRRLVERARLGR